MVTSTQRQTYRESEYKVTNQYTEWQSLTLTLSVHNKVFCGLISLPCWHGFLIISLLWPLIPAWFFILQLPLSLSCATSCPQELLPMRFSPPHFQVWLLNAHSLGACSLVWPQFIAPFHFTLRPLGHLLSFLSHLSASLFYPYFAFSILLPTLLSPGLRSPEA